MKRMCEEGNNRIKLIKLKKKITKKEEESLIKKDANNIEDNNKRMCVCNIQCVYQVSWIIIKITKV